MELQTPVIVKEVADEKRGDERRKEATVYTQRKFIRRGREFIFPLTVYLSDTNAFGNVYFAQYFVWQGKTREDFFFWLMPNYVEFVKTGIKLVTVEASMRYIKECVVYDNVVVGLSVDNIRKASVELKFVFRLRKNNEIVGIGRQVIGFVNQAGKIVGIPEELKNNLKLKIS